MDNFSTITHAEMAVYVLKVAFLVSFRFNCIKDASHLLDLPGRTG